MKPYFKTLTMTLGALALAGAAHAATVTVGSGGFNDGWATTITYEDDNSVARRGTSNDRDNALNALGPNDGNFFELGFRGSADFTFGKKFKASAQIFEVTFGSASSFPEAVDVYVGDGGLFQFVARISNVAAQGGGIVPLTGLIGSTFDTLRLVDASPLSSSAQSDQLGRLGGFDIDAIRVAPVPLPAAGAMLIAAIGGLAFLRRRRKPEA